ATVVWENLGTPDPFILAELGPGRGTLMADALRAARLRPEFLEAARLHLVETSPVLAESQRKSLCAFEPTFHDDPADLPEGPLILIANEFFDALPIQQLVATETGWSERCVGLAPGGGTEFAFTDGPTVETSKLPDGLPVTAEPGAILEISPIAQDILRGLARRCRSAPTAILIVDYGHRQSAAGETLQAVRGHGYADPLAEPGSADLTAHVDFAALARTARSQGAAVFGPVEQGKFLLALGIGTRAEKLKQGAGDEQARNIESALKRLVNPAEMGALFKVMAVLSPTAPSPPGFEA
ncbi:MAG TPA: SAM-dependent methyltransferase, partial [Alphaproteobacteria bacterium]|nr:SAM-dependent methyltransferase [Alphaproteobacteria bacterium]